MLLLNYNEKEKMTQALTFTEDVYLDLGVDKGCVAFYYYPDEVHHQPLEQILDLINHHDSNYMFIHPGAHVPIEYAHIFGRKNVQTQVVMKNTNISWWLAFYLGRKCTQNTKVHLYTSDEKMQQEWSLFMGCKLFPLVPRSNVDTENTDFLEFTYDLIQDIRNQVICLPIEVSDFTLYVTQRSTISAQYLCNYLFETGFIKPNEKTHCLEMGETMTEYLLGHSTHSTPGMGAQAPVDPQN